jgi:hypothetical protein
LKEFCDINGILRQFIVPCNLKQNGVIFKRDVVFNEKVMFLKEEGTTFDAFVYDPIMGKDEGFIFHNGEFEK